MDSVSNLCLCCQPLSQPFFALLDRIEIVEAWKLYILNSLVNWTPIRFCQWKSMWDNERKKRGEVNLSPVINNIFDRKSSIYSTAMMTALMEIPGLVEKKKQSSQKLSANLEPMANTKAECVDTWILASNASCFLFSGYQLDLSFLLQFLFPVLFFQLLQPMYVNSLY